MLLEVGSERGTSEDVKAPCASPRAFVFYITTVVVRLLIVTEAMTLTLSVVESKDGLVAVQHTYGCKTGLHSTICYVCLSCPCCCRARVHAPVPKPPKEYMYALPVLLSSTLACTRAKAAQGVYVCLAHVAVIHGCNAPIPKPAKSVAA